jgi:hypothetical protein
VAEVQGLTAEEEIQNELDGVGLGWLVVDSTAVPRQLTIARIQ